jgi:hypothetical protein
MTGAELATFAEEVKRGASIGSTFLLQLFNICKALVEQRLPWMVLRSTDTSKSITTANTWQTAIDLSTITGFNRFYGEYPTTGPSRPVVVPYAGVGRRSWLQTLRFG